MNDRGKYIFLILVIVAAALSSCRKYLDINHDPNNATEGDPKTLFSFAITSFVNNRAGGDLFIPMALAGQSQSSGGSSSTSSSWGQGTEDQYVFSPLTYSNIWTQYYTSVAANLKKAIELCETTKPANNNGAAQAKIVLAETFYELTTTYGDIPFGGALDINNLSPKFDDQETVLNGCLALLDSAIAQIDLESGFKFDSPYDMFYQGDLDKWKKAAACIKLRILMTMVDRDPSKKSAIGALATSGALMTSAADNFQIPFENVAGKRNPKYQLKTDYTGDIDFLYASPFVLDYMKARNDPRIPFFFDKAPDATEYNSTPAGTDANDMVASRIASSLHSPTQPECVFSYQEQLFYLAEIYDRGLGVPPSVSTADKYYRDALEQSALYFGVPAGQAEGFAGSIPYQAAPDALLADIHYQHWIDKFDRGIDAFIQWRRSGAEGSEIPKLTLPHGAYSKSLFRRYEYPESAELSSNPNAPELIDFTQKVWFDL